MTGKQDNIIPLRRGQGEVKKTKKKTTHPKLLLLSKQGVLYKKMRFLKKNMFFLKKKVKKRLPVKKFFVILLQ